MFLNLCFLVSCLRSWLPLHFIHTNILCNHTEQSLAIIIVLFNFLSIDGTSQWVKVYGWANTHTHQSLSLLILTPFSIISKGIPSEFFSFSTIVGSEETFSTYFFLPCKSVEDSNRFVPILAVQNCLNA